MIAFIMNAKYHDDVIKWKHFPRHWPFVRGIYQSPVNSLHKGQWRGALMFSLLCAWMNDWVNNREAGDFRRHRAHYEVIVMNWDKKKTILRSVLSIWPIERSILGSVIYMSTPRDHPGYGLSHWDMMLQNNVFSCWLCPCPAWSLVRISPSPRYREILEH